MLEKNIEMYFNKQIKKMGGLSRKFTSPGQRGVPDRIAILNGQVYFVELKRPGQKPRPDQLAEHRTLAKHGVKVYVLDSKYAVDVWLENLKGATF
ncbi:VRR-NUC domain-containing protein [Fundicoccus sp. Sow4_D5]|uniref:VRR-NUC domain-containing protein n=1 Tax=Fundicoccus sp. Sow4_D5 TaxID=3438782 RepID=UPI003F92E274